MAKRGHGDMKTSGHTSFMICKMCTYYNMSLEAIEEHKKQTGHNWQIVHTSTSLRLGEDHDNYD